MKQFNLEEYNRRVAEGETPELVTRDGHKSRIICTDRKCNEYTIVFLVLSDNGIEVMRSCTEEGITYVNEENDFDLFFATRKKIINGWVNVYKHGFGYLYCSEESALRAKDSSCIKTIEISTEIEVD